MNFVEVLKNEKENLFHFYIILGNPQINRGRLFSFLKDSLGLVPEGNSNFYHFSEKNLSIESARKIKKINALKKDNNELRIFVLESQKIENESQNALLKTLEEPQEGTIFFLLLPSTALILDTIKSRTRILISGESENNESALKFLAGNFLEREKMIKKIVRDSEDSAEARFIFLELISFIDQVILENKEKLIEKEKDFLKSYEKFLNLKEQAKFRGSNLTNIMIFLAIILPKI